VQLRAFGRHVRDASQVSSVSPLVLHVGARARLYRAGEGRSVQAHGRNRCGAGSDGACDDRVLREVAQLVVLVSIFGVSAQRATGRLTRSRVSA
jgi:hypothetical protein